MRELRPAQAICTFTERQIELKALFWSDADLGDNVRKMGRTADAVSANVGIADVGMGPEDHLDRIGEVEIVVDVARLAMAVLLQSAQSVFHLGRDPAEWAEQVPLQEKQPLTSAVKARPNHGIARSAKPA